MIPSTHEIFVFRFGITAVAILVNWSQKWPYLGNRVKPERTLIGSDWGPKKTGCQSGSHALKHTLLYISCYFKWDHTLLNEHHAVLRNYQLRPLTHQENVYWGIKFSEKSGHFLISLNRIFFFGTTWKYGTGFIFQARKLHFSSSTLGKWWKNGF